MLRKYAVNRQAQTKVKTYKNKFEYLQKSWHTEGHLGLSCTTHVYMSLV